jgi:hypothetical protein
LILQRTGLEREPIPLAGGAWINGRAVHNRARLITLDRCGRPYRDIGSIRFSPRGARLQNKYAAWSIPADRPVPKLGSFSRFRRHRLARCFGEHGNWVRFRAFADDCLQSLPATHENGFVFAHSLLALDERTPKRAIGFVFVHWLLAMSGADLDPPRSAARLAAGAPICLE